MGRYLNKTSRGAMNQTGKADQLIVQEGAKKITQPRNFEEVPSDKALVCVVYNPHHGGFDAAAYCYSAREFEAFTIPSDARTKTWLLMSKERVEQLAD